MEEYELEEGLILTLDEDEIIRQEGKNEKKIVVVKSAWRWMLE